MAERMGGAAKVRSETRDDGASLIQAVAPAPVPPSTSTDEHDALMAILVDELRVAATEAGKDGFYRMAGVLDDCGLALGRQTACEKYRLIERARQSLELWRALRDW